MADVFTFGEGRTDGNVFNKVANRFFGERISRRFIPVNGKDNFSRVIKESVESELGPGRDVHILIFRDLDNGETPVGIVDSFHRIVRSLLSKWSLKPDFRPHHQYSNIYLCEQPSSKQIPGLRMVLHLADTEGFSFPCRLHNQSTDGYVLAAGLENVVLDQFAREGKVKGTSSELHTLITKAIPGEISKAGIHFDEDKDFLASYLCATRFYVVKRTDDRARLASIILDHALEKDPAGFDRIFVTWKEAITEAIK